MSFGSSVTNGWAAKVRNARRSGSALRQWTNEITIYRKRRRRLKITAIQTADRDEYRTCAMPSASALRPPPRTPPDALPPVGDSRTLRLLSVVVAGDGRVGRGRASRNESDGDVYSPPLPRFRARRRSPCRFAPTNCRATLNGGRGADDSCEYLTRSSRQIVKSPAEF